MQPEVINNFLPGFSPIFSEVYLYTSSTVASSPTWSSKVDPSKPLISKDFLSPLGSGSACEAGADLRGLGADGGKVREETINNAKWYQTQMDKLGLFATTNHGYCFLLNLDIPGLGWRVTGKPRWIREQNTSKYKPWFPVKFPWNRIIPMAHCTKEPFSAKLRVYGVICRARAHPAAGVHACELKRWCFHPMKRFDWLETTITI